MIILKFGGSSVGSQKGLEHVISILKDKEHSPSGQCIVTAIVVSAFSKVTDTLILLAKNAASGIDCKDKTEELRKRHKETAAIFLKGQDKKKCGKRNRQYRQ